MNSWQTTIMCLCIQLTVGLNIQMNANKQYCFGVEGAEQYHVEYLVSGVNDKNAIWQARSEGKVLQSNHNSSDYNTDLTIPEAGAEFCFRITDAYSKILSVNFFPSSKKISTSSTKVDVLAAQEELNRAMHQLQTVYRNQHYQLERDNVHTRILDSTVEKIKTTGLMKVGVVVAMALFQLWIMKRFVTQQHKYTEI